MSALIDILRNGHTRYRNSRLPEYRPLFQELTERGQRPKAMVIACSDSRVDPALLFDQRPGDLFIVRNVANIVPPHAPDFGCNSTSAALEFAITGLELANIIVMGHALCGGVDALIEMAENGKSVGEFIGPWMSIAEPAVAIAKEDETSSASQNVRTEQAIIKLSLQNLTTYPWVKERISAGKLSLHGFYFDIADGSVMWLNPETDKYEDFI